MEQENVNALSNSQTKMNTLSPDKTAAMNRFIKFEEGT